MKCKAFLCTLAIGMAAGAALSILTMPKRQRSQSMVGKVLKTAGEIADRVGKIIE